jgi:hypothetical protein
MGDFNIRGRVQRNGPLGFTVIAYVVPAGRDDASYTLLTEKEASNHTAAITLLRDIAVEMGQKLRRDGHQVLGVQLDET